MSSSIIGTSILTLPLSIDASKITTGTLDTARIDADSVANARTRSTGTTVSAGNVAISESSNSFNTSSQPRVDVTNLSVTITTSGRPIFIGCVPDNSGIQGSGINLRRNLVTTGNAQGTIFLVRGDSTTVFSIPLSVRAEAVVSGSSDQSGTSITPLSFGTIDVQPAGTYTYKMQVNNASPNISTISVTRCKLLAYEL
jgi:hypothetical protein